MLGKRKRPPQLESQQRELLCQILAEQFDLEIALKKRLAAAAHARLEWAKLLRGSIVDNSVKGEYPPAAFRDAALATYETIEAPCQIITSATDLPLPSLTNGKHQGSSAIPVLETPRTRKRVMLGLVRGLSAGPGPILFEDRSTSRPVTLKLVCTDCSRSNFPTMQGFVNHCRLAHFRVYGTHDECIQATGVIIDDSEREALLASGVEINTIQLPSLRGLFERAVGLTTSNILAQAAAPRPSSPAEESAGDSTHLSQTLGFHKDTPTLAPFLGREVKKKRIHVYDDSQPIDVISCEDEGQLPQKLSSWFTKHRPNRGTVSDWSTNLMTSAADGTGNLKPSSDVVFKPLDVHASRFHVTRRVLISDRSLYLPESKRPTALSSHTHRWQISVSSPSYSQHISTFLSRFTVACVTQPPVFDGSILVSGAPFVACSTASKPFLARLTFEWVGEQNQPLQMDHWVELDRLRATRPVLGDVQIIDVELDRNTLFLPVYEDTNIPSWDGDDDSMKKDVVDNNLVPTLQPSAVVSNMSSQEFLLTPLPDINYIQESEFSKLLRDIIPRFPITLQDCGACLPQTLPYVVYPSRAKLLSLLPGRRKAIEWRRASAIRAELDAVHGSSIPKNARPTTADVYRWLETEGHFPRPRRPTLKPTPKAKSIDTAPTTQPRRPLGVSRRFCPVCGVNVEHHVAGLPLGSQDPDVAGPEKSGFRCSPELERWTAPLVHVYGLLSTSRMPYSTSHMRTHVRSNNITSSTPRDIVTAAHPHLTNFVRREVTSLSLSCFSLKHGIDENKRLPLGDKTSLDINPQDVFESLSTHALLAIVLEKLVKNVIENALQSAREMQNRTRTVRDEMRDDTPTSLLTPTHVFQGLLVKDADPRWVKEGLLKCFSRIGTLLAPGGFQNTKS